MSGVQIAHTLPRDWVADRLDHLGRVASGRRVLHLGFADSPQMESAIERGVWLHARLVATAECVYGIDIDERAVEAARTALPMATVSAGDISDERVVQRAVDVSRPDLIIVSEVIEHLASPGSALAAIAAAASPGTEMVVTTPNAFGLRRLVHALLRGVEVVHPDHRCYFSAYTLSALLREHGFDPDSVTTYGVEGGPMTRIIDGVCKRIAPQCLPGLIVHATRN